MESTRYKNCNNNYFTFFFSSSFRYLQTTTKKMLRNLQALIPCTFSAISNQFFGFPAPLAHNISSIHSALHLDFNDSWGQTLKRRTIPVGAFSVAFLSVLTIVSLILLLIADRYNFTAHQLLSCLIFRNASQRNQLPYCHQPLAIKQKTQTKIQGG